MNKIEVRKLSAVLQAIALAAMVAVQTNITALPPKYQAPVTIVIAILQAVMPAPVTSKPVEEPVTE